MPKPVKSVEIPKKDGGVRVLGIPTVEDRIAQMAVVLIVQDRLESVFVDDSYGYRPGKSALDAVGACRKRCWKYDYVIDLDIKGMFDNIDHDLLMRAVRKHIGEKWALLYIKRWLVAPSEFGGIRTDRDKGTPQGGVVSPLLANLFMHYALDLWMKRNHPYIPIERYADDTVLHCKTLKQAKFILDQVKTRLGICKLEPHPQKTKIVYCQDRDRTLEYGGETTFDFLGYTFGRVMIRDKMGRFQFNFLASASKKSCKGFRHKIRDMEVHKWSGSSLDIVAERLNPMLRGWINYFAAFNRSTITYSLECVERRLVKWAMCKFKRFRGHRRRAIAWLKRVKEREPALFAHWAYV
jgi:group II intron reverse transcriptase/maturase